jgi:uncharacterized protein with GYD domain
MPKYILLFKYSPDGAKGFLKEKAEAREAEIKKAYASVGGKVEAVHWAAGGEYTGVVVAEMPDAASVAAFAMLVGSSGALDTGVGFEVLTSKEFDKALSKGMTYRPPGG